MAAKSAEPPLFGYQELTVARLEQAMEKRGEVSVVLSRERANLLEALIELQAHHDRLQAHPTPAGVRFREALRAAWFVVRLSLFHRRLFEVQRLAFVLSSSRRRRDEPGDRVVFSFAR